MRYFLNIKIPFKFYLHFMIVVDTFLALINLTNLVLLFDKSNITQNTTSSIENNNSKLVYT